MSISKIMRDIKNLTLAPSKIPLFIVKTEEKDTEKFLSSIGISPGSLITVPGNDGNVQYPLIIEFQENHFSIDRKKAEMIFVVPAFKMPENIFKGNKTRQRDIILDVLTNFLGHFTLAECTDAVQKKHKNIGKITIYRALKTLMETGVIRGIDLPDGSRKMEILKGLFKRKRLIVAGITVFLNPISSIRLIRYPIILMLALHCGSGNWKLPLPGKFPASHRGSSGQNRKSKKSLQNS